VERDHGPPAEGAASFHTTRWTIVMRAAQSQAQGGQSALAELCRLYWYPLYIFARRRGHSPDDAQDLTQGFFLHVVEHRAVTGVDRLKGKFRSFLLASFQNHLSDAGDRARRLKRGGDKEFVQLDAEAAEERYRLEPVEFLTPEKMFDAQWAMTVLGEALKQLRQEYASAGKASTFEALKIFLDPNNSSAPPSYDEVASLLQVTTGGGQNTYPSLAKAIHLAVARGSWPHGVRSDRGRRGNPCPLRFWCKLLKGSVSCDNCRDDGTDLGTRSVQGTAL
jgi:RNA polymerase sigma factor (sigma-70 family)